MFLLIVVLAFRVLLCEYVAILICKVELWRNLKALHGLSSLSYAEGEKAEENKDNWKNASCIERFVKEPLAIKSVQQLSVAQR